MAEVLPMITFAFQYDEMDRQEDRNNREIRKQNILNKKKYEEQKQEVRRNLAFRRARQYADGYTGRTYNRQLGRINKFIKQPFYNRAGSGGNILNRINLFAKTIKKMSDGK